VLLSFSLLLLLPLQFSRFLGIHEWWNNNTCCNYFWGSLPSNFDVMFFRPDVMQENNRVLTQKHTYTHTLSLSHSLSLFLFSLILFSLFLGVFFLTIWLFASLQNSLTCDSHTTQDASLSLSLCVQWRRERKGEARGEKFWSIPMNNLFVPFFKLLHTQVHIKSN